MIAAPPLIAAPLIEVAPLTAPPLTHSEHQVDAQLMTQSQQPSAGPPVSPAIPLTQVETDAAIGDLRVEIDAVDAALVELVARRIQISKQVGQLRMAAGGTRLSLSREQAVVARFSAELGETGTSLAMLLLRAGRGRL